MTDKKIGRSKWLTPRQLDLRDRSSFRRQTATSISSPRPWAPMSWRFSKRCVPSWRPRSRPLSTSIRSNTLSRSKCCPPSRRINLLTQDDKFQKYDLTSLKTLAYGGSPMAPELVHRIREVLPNLKLVQSYGLSEAGFLTGLKDNEHTEDRLMSCGRTCPGIDLRIVDESGKEVEPGGHGELVARGANVMSGYWKKPEETKHAFRDGFFRTGDIGYRDAKGYFYILDRLKDMIVTGGE